MTDTPNIDPTTLGNTIGIILTLHPNPPVDRHDTGGPLQVTANPDGWLAVRQDGVYLCDIERALVDPDQAVGRFRYVDDQGRVIVHHATVEART